ncbi:hypothetical protein AB0G02_30330 [Actinosynnema sp. NPDC023658]|uniref:hypothetical protein n=1 Tax=Actinosynnema sp. NPDC023658 TaxID=3155465 RepID=UPI0033DF841C
MNPHAIFGSRAAAILYTFAIGAWPLPTGSAQANEPGTLTLEAQPAKVAAGGVPISVKIGNSGGAPVRGVGLTVKGPPGLQTEIKPTALDRLEGGASAIAVVTTSGAVGQRPSALILEATGTSDAGDTVALATVDIATAEAAASLTLAGNTRLSDRSPADVLAIITNPGDAQVDGEVRAAAGGHDVRLAAAATAVSQAPVGTPLRISVPAHGTAIVFVQVTANAPLRRGVAPVVVTAALGALDE